MTNIIIAVIIGIIFGWVVGAGWMAARLGRNAIWLNRQAMSPERLVEEMASTDAVLRSAEAADDLVLLACLENGQVGDVKRVLIYKLGLFYHRWAAKPAREIPESIQKSLSAIRDAAKEFESVQTVITHDPANGPPPA